MTQRRDQGSARARRRRDSCGLSETELRGLSALVTTNILANPTTRAASVVLPGSGWAEKRGSMINIKGRLQRLNRAVNCPRPGAGRLGNPPRSDPRSAARNGLAMIEDVFRQMAAEIPAFSGLSLSKIGDLGVPLQLSPACLPDPWIICTPFPGSSSWSVAKTLFLIFGVVLPMVSYTVYAERRISALIQDRARPEPHRFPAHPVRRQKRLLALPRRPRPARRRCREVSPEGGVHPGSRQ